MDPSALIFVALAVAWAGYLIPKALEHHEESSRTRTIDKFSHGLRILARREPRSRRTSQLVTVADAPPPPPPPPPPCLVPAVLTPAQQRSRRLAVAAAARRRRRILDLLFLANVGVAAAAILGYLAWHWQCVPAGLVLVWLFASRRARVRERRTPMVEAPVGVTTADSGFAPVPEADVDPDYFTTGFTGVLAAVEGAMPFDPKVPQQDPDGWEMLPFVVPTYVGKELARRSVRTIDLDSTGVWSAGRNAADSALVRDADAAAATRAEERDSGDGRAAASGS